MPEVWLRPGSGGEWSRFATVAEAVKHLNSKGTELFATQVSCATGKAATRNGWCFRSSPPGAEDSEAPERHMAAPPVSSPSPVQTGLSTFFTSTGTLPNCGCCGEKLLGDIIVCPSCNQRVHALCKEGAKCFRCVCRVCDSPPGDVMRPCKSCKHRVHATCAVVVPHRIEWLCKTCMPKPRQEAPPAQKKTRRHFNPQWQVGKPWLKFSNGVMWCVACQQYPQPGMHQSWLVGTTSFRRLTVVEHTNSGLHSVALALWQSNGASTTVIGSLAEPVRKAIFGLFHLVYRIAKRCGPFTDLAQDAAPQRWWVVLWHLHTAPSGPRETSLTLLLHPFG